MFKLEKLRDKAVLTVYGYVGGYYLEPRNIADALTDITNSGYKQIDFHMHTNGGDVFDGNLIYNFLASFKGTVDIYIDGIAASMGAIMIMSVPAARVHIAENGFLMLHSPTCYVNGTANDLIATAKMLRSMEKNFKSKLSERLGKTPEQIDTDYFDGSEHWIDADEAITLGLVGDKFTAQNGALKFSKAEAETIGLRSMLNRYVALATKDNFNQTFDEMKQVNMKLKLKEDAPEPEAVAAIEALELKAANAILERDAAKQKEADATQKLNDKITEIEGKEKAAATAKAETLIADAVKDGRLNDDAEHKAVGFWKKSFESDFEGASTALAALPKHKSIGAGLNGAPAENAWDKRQKEIAESNKK